MQSDNPSQDSKEPVPFGAGILPGNGDRSEARAAPTPTAPERDEAVSNGEDLSEAASPLKTEPSVEPVAPAKDEGPPEDTAPADSEPASGTSESPAQPEPENVSNQDESVTEELEEDDIMEFKIVEPPDYQDEAEAFAQLHPGPREEVRFDERPRHYPRRTRKRPVDRKRTGDQRHDVRTQRKPEPARSVWTAILRWISGLFGKRN